MDVINSNSFLFSEKILGYKQNHTKNIYADIFLKKEKMCHNYVTIIYVLSVTKVSRLFQAITYLHRQ
jgi:hypothetical protein